ncbi:MAG: hypothetical protein DRH57_02290 [Candidatus Cloacimonadota bacterium]|nr:MAG: hypothetical protein DRH57_02290 [Candidatus Cloacimonadota bacterium]
MKKYFLVITLVCSLFYFFLSPFSLIAGRYAGDFIAIGAGVRSLSMGGAFVAVANDGSAIYWNAAGISQIREKEIILMRAFLYDNIASYDFISLCIPLPSDVSVGLAWTRLSIDDIPYFSEKHLTGTNTDQRSSDINKQLTGIPDGEFSSSDNLFQFAFSKHISQLVNMGWLFFEVPIDYYFGATIKYIKRDLYKFSATGTGVDLSAMIKSDLAILTELDWLGEIRYGINIQDVAGTKITWDTKSRWSDEIITNTKMGVAVVQPIPKIHSVITIDYDWDNAYKYTSHIGLELQYKKFAFLRTGYSDDDYSFGAGITYRRFNINYAFLTNVLANTHRVGVRISF